MSFAGVHTSIMRAFKSRAQRQLDDESSDDDDSFISQLLELCARFRIENEDVVVRSLAMLLFIGIEKAATGGCFKIIWREIRRMVQIYSVGGSCSFTSNWFIVFV